MRASAANRAQRAPHSGMPPHMRQHQQQQRTGMQQQHQQVIEHDENLSDKEIFPMHQVNF